MSLSNTSESDLLKLLFQNTSWANVGDATGIVHSTTAGSFFIGLATSDPGEAGDQTTNEISYVGYARVPVARSSGGWTLSGTAPTQVANAAIINFGLCTGGSGTATFFVVGRDTSGTGEIIASGALTASLAISTGITPSFAIGSLTITAD